MENIKFSSKLHDYREIFKILQNMTFKHLESMENKFLQENVDMLRFLYYLFSYTDDVVVDIYIFFCIF